MSCKLGGMSRKLPAVWSSTHNGCSWTFPERYAMSKSEFRAETYQDLLDEHVKLRGMLRDLESQFAERRGPFTERVAQLTAVTRLSR